MKKKCKHKSGYYQYSVISGKTVRHYDEKGNFIEASMDLTHERDLKSKYCCDCDKRLNI